MGKQKSGTHLVYMTAYLSSDFPPSRSFVHKLEDFPLYAQCAGRLDTSKPSPTLPLILISHPFKEGLKGTARDSLHYPDRILSYIFAVPMKRVRFHLYSRIRRSCSLDQGNTLAGERSSL